MNGILSLIFMLSINSLDKNVTYNIANYFIEHLNEIESKNIREVSKDSYTSTTSLLKFCQLLGFDSYNEFKNQFVYTLKDRIRQLHRKLKEETEEEFLDKIINLSIFGMDKDKFLQGIEELVDSIHQEKVIYFYGAVFPLNLCVSFGEDMTIMGIPVHFIQISYKSEQIHIKEGLHIILTYTGRFIEQRKFHYLQIVDNAKKSVLISREQEYVGDVDIILPLPKTKTIDYDDAILLFILDMIKLRYYQKYFKK